MNCWNSPAMVSTVLAPQDGTLPSSLPAWVLRPLRMLTLVSLFLFKLFIFFYWLIVISPNLIWIHLSRFEKIRMMISTCSSQSNSNFVFSREAVASHDAPCLCFCFVSSGSPSTYFEVCWTLLELVSLIN